MGLIVAAEQSYFAVILYLLLLATTTIIYSRWHRKYAIRSLKQQHGCQDPPHYSHKDAWGLDLVKERARAMKEGRYFKLYETHFAKYGKTFQECTRGQVIINTMEPANIKQILALAFDDYGKDPGRVKAQAPFLGPSVFSDGMLWQHSRAMVKPIFARAEITDMEHLKLFTEEFMKLIPGDGGMVDMQPLLHRLFLDVSMDFIFSKSVNAFQVDTPTEVVEFLDAFTKAQRWVTKRREAGWLRFRYDFDKDWKKSYTTVHKFVDKQVKQALERTASEHGTSKAISSSERERYLLIDELAKQIRDPIHLRYQLLGVLMPARDTTSTLVGNALFQLARHPKIWTELRKTSLGVGDESLTFERLKSFVNFRHVLHETIRIIGPSARVVRSAIRDTILPVGGGLDQKSAVFVPKGTTVSMGMWCLHHDKDIWDDDVQEFKPARWVGHKPLWEFLPFSGGPRICPAQQQVLTHATFILVRLTQKFESIENQDPVFDYIEKFSMGFESRNGVKVAFKKPT